MVQLSPCALKEARKQVKMAKRSKRCSNLSAVGSGAGTCLAFSFL
jgi:hypothetical protein